MKSLPKSGHHAVMCAFIVFWSATKTTLLGVEENGVLVVREVVADLLLEGGLVKVVQVRKSRLMGLFDSGRPRWTSQPWHTDLSLCPRIRVTRSVATR